MNLPGAFNVLVPGNRRLAEYSHHEFLGQHHEQLRPGQRTRAAQDKNGKTVSTAGSWANAGVARDWNNTGGHVMGPNGFMADIPAGAIGSIYSSDPNDWLVQAPEASFSWAVRGTPARMPVSTADRVPNATGCTFAGSANGTLTDIGTWLPITDVYGNSLFPATNPLIAPSIRPAGSSHSPAPQTRRGRITIKGH